MDDEDLICQDCGTVDDVRETICPFAKEISDKEVEIVVCSYCYRERAMDI